MCGYLAGCLAESDDLPASTGEQDINGPTSAASLFQLDRAVAVPGCTATRIGSHWALSALHCQLQNQLGKQVVLYDGGPGFNRAKTALIRNVMPYPGTDASRCKIGNVHLYDGHGCSNGNGYFSDIVILDLQDDAVSGLSDVPSKPAATMAWLYPGNNVNGQKVGAGNHDGNVNRTGLLLQVPDSTGDASDSNGAFHTNHVRVDGGDSGGPFYVSSQIVGTLTGNPDSIFSALHTSVPSHLDWILSSTNYIWPGSPPLTGIQYTGTGTIGFSPKTERVCQYACEHTASCQAYNYTLATQSCTLVSGISGTQAMTGVKSALHYGQSGGKSGDDVGYVRSDGFNAVVHRATDGTVHELTAQGGAWVAGGLSNRNANGDFPPAATSKLSAYRRGDGTNVVVYRAGNVLVEIALDPVQGWTWSDLTSWGGQVPTGDPVGFVRADGESAVVFRSVDGHINELRLGPSSWIPSDLSSKAGISTLVASSDPSAFVRSDGYTSVVFRAGTQIFELYQTAGQDWRWGQPTGLTNTPSPDAASRPYGYTHHDGTTAIVYRTSGNRIAELWLDGLGWHVNDLGISAAHLAGGNPFAYVRTDALEAVVYRENASIYQPTTQIWELANNPWQANNLTSWGAEPSTGDPTAYIRNDGFNSVLFRTSSNRIGELAIQIGDTAWHPGNLSLSAGETP